MATLVIPEYDAGIAFYVGKLGFDLIEDTDLGGGKRWVRVSPAGSGSGRRGAQLLLAKPKNDSERASIGNQTGGRVSFFLETDNFADTYSRFREAGVTFLERPRNEAYGSVAVFTDSFGNLWDLLERKVA
jgi:catechol 2,3-dioxygenase-like lactoylglutathione lyase family enzyme